MTDPLSEATEILKALKYELSRCRELWTATDRDNPQFDLQTDHHWQKKLATSWIYGTTDMLESNELVNWRAPLIPQSEMASSNARESVKYWREWMEIEDMYYEPFVDFVFPILDMDKQLSAEAQRLPYPNEKLIDFVHRLARRVEKEGWGCPIEERALRSFLGYVRRFHEESAFLEHIFPKRIELRDGMNKQIIDSKEFPIPEELASQILKMGLHHGMIIRNIDPERYPIPEELACQILMTFADMSLEGRKDARLTALEGLGLSWVCLTAARLKLPLLYEELPEIKVSSLKRNEQQSSLTIPTLFGLKEVPISRKIAQFLFSLSSIPTKEPIGTIFRRPRRSLTRAFDRVLASIGPNPKFGNITYASLITLPHHFGDHRYLCI